nr:TraU family protein [Variovorax boronicumulans]
MEHRQARAAGPRHRLRAVAIAAAASLLIAGPAAAQLATTNTAAIMGATVAAIPSCLAYRVTGVCFWLRCTPFGCSVKTSIKVSHYMPDVVVSTYGAPEQHPWADVGVPVAGIMTGLGSSFMGSLLDSSADTAREAQEVATFKSADAFGNPVGAFMGGVTTWEYPDAQELMNFPSQELPRIAQMWASVPRDLANGVLEGARATAMNPQQLLGELGNIPGQLSGMMDSISNLGGLLTSTTGDMGGGSGDGGGTTGESGGTGGGSGGGTGGQSWGDMINSAMTAGGRGLSEYICPGGSGMLSLQYHSELDSLFWRGKIPLELLYPGSWVPGIGEVGNSLINTWGGEYPRMGELVQSHPRKASAVMAHRVGSVIRRGAQPHIYKKLYAKGGGFRYFAQVADPKWQAVHPVPEPGCMTFGANDSLGVGSWGDYQTSGNNGYVWNLWHRYECCSKAAPIFLFAVP